MIKAAGRLGIASFMVLAWTAYSPSADAQTINFKDVGVSRPYRDSILILGSDGQPRTGIEARELEKAVEQVRDQARALDELRTQNRALERKVDEQGRKIASLERNQNDSSRKSSDNANERQISALERQVNQLSRDLDRLSSKVK
ncbi:hypothetical protein [Achromobacter marplatensis]|uniref:hypothetical protein n=1 Tax=Achromobacter marplatensis TaxID=470868 RepID=UPI0039F6A91F